MKVGTVYLVGAGPGDPKLLTVRGEERLRQADLVVYDHLVSPRILQLCPETAARVYVGKEADRRTLSQSAINRLLVRGAKSGKTVVRLKGGDPFLFGRGGEEAQALKRSGVAFEVVPGVTSALAVPAYAGIPVTHRALSSSVAIVTGHEDPEKPQSVIRWEHLAKACETLVFLMGVRPLGQIAARLIRHGRHPETPCAVIEWGTLPRQRTITGTLRTISQRANAREIHPPAVFIVGQVVSLRHQLQWAEARPLAGKRILVTRASEKAQALADQLEALGADIEQLPAIELIPIEPNGAFQDAVRDIPRADWIFFTSPEGIGRLATLLRPYRKDVRWLAGCHIGAIGPKTAVALERHGLRVDFVPRRFSQEGMARDLPRRLLSGKRALILSAERSRDVLERALRSRGMRVKKVPIYRTVIPAELRGRVGVLLSRPFDFVTATSASCVEHLFQVLQAAGRSSRFRRLRFASIGPVTSQAIRTRGARVAAEARVSTVEGLVAAMVRRSRR